MSGPYTVCTSLGFGTSDFGAGGPVRAVSGTTWDYIKVRQKEFYELQPAVFSDITFMR